ncbi:MAG: hypothetical protein KC441_20755, partial [Anaerolineales bacterium]|nr:hypothetical protein [Anaerolineales bacterium]
MPVRHTNYHVQKIARLLERAESSGQHPWRIFEDWTTLVEAFLDTMPRLLLAQWQGQQPDIPAEIVEREKQVTAKYR